MITEITVNGWCEATTATGDRCSRDVYRPLADGRHLCWQHKEMERLKHESDRRDSIIATAQAAGLNDDAILLVWGYTFGESAWLFGRHNVGTVYIMRNDALREGPFHKIGMTSDSTPDRRRTSIENAIGVPIAIVDYARVGNARGLESYLHHVFSDKRRIGEWFDLTDGDIALVRAHLSAASFLANVGAVEP